MKKRKIRLENVVDETADIISSAIIKSVESRGRCFIAFSGGTSPVPMYEKLAKKLPGDVSSKLHIYLVDERVVPLDSQDSNFRLIKETFINHLEKLPENSNIHPLQVDVLPQEASKIYDKLLESAFVELGSLDIVILGIGQDGHTASLFPQHMHLFPNEENRFAFATHEAVNGHFRVSMTYKTILASKKAFVYAPGESKKDILKKIIKKEGNPTYPSQYILSNHDDIELIYTSSLD